MKRVLISVSDKRGIVNFAKFLEENDYEIISTGGTEKILKEAGIKTLNISDITGFPEIMDGRVKTLHPNVHGGLLCVRNNPEHMKALLENNIELIDMVVVNLYPFKEALEKNSTHEELIENIDIGGPSMLRSAAKNHRFVTVCVDPNDYRKIQEDIINYKDTTTETKNYLAAKVFRYTSAYDSLIANYLTSKLGDKFPEIITLSYEKVQNLRYGENPHQEAAFYRNSISGFCLGDAEQLNGKELSFNNIQDTNAALQILKEFTEPTVVAVKHMNPCGVGSGSNLNLAWKRAFSADPISIFGGIIVANREINEETAKEMSELFLEIIVAPHFTDSALEVFSKKKNLRVLKLDLNKEVKNSLSITNVCDGVLIQDMDSISNFKDMDISKLQCVTEKQPSEKELEEMRFLWKIVKHVKSNAIVIGNGSQTFGVGAGQMNRVGAAKIALEQSGVNAHGAFLASDAFFPMSDTVELAAKYGIKGIIQPGGSIKDKDSIDKCNELGITMLFTNRRHFKH